MRFAIMIVMLHSQLCFALVTGAESKGEIPDVNAHPDLTKISAILSMAEQDWRNNDYIQYLDKVESICKKLVYRRDVNTEEYTFFLETASKMLLKSYADVKPKSLKFRGYEQVANVLLSDTLVQIQTPAERFSILRSQNTRLLMVILSRAIAQKDQNWQAKPVFHNIDPPINPDNEPLLAGMAPSAIKNPEAKAAYEKAIAENAKASEERAVQLAIERLLKRIAPMTDNYLVRVYSRAPVNEPELAEYLALGNFDAGNIRKIIDEVRKQNMR